MSTFLRIIGAFALFGSILFGLTSPMALIAIVASGIVSCVTFWWMAAIRDAADDANETLGEMAMAMKAMAAKTGAVVPDDDGAKEPAKAPAKPAWTWKHQ